MFRLTNKAIARYITDIERTTPINHTLCKPDNPAHPHDMADMVNPYFMGKPYKSFVMFNKKSLD